MQDFASIAAKLGGAPVDQVANTGTPAQATSSGTQATSQTVVPTNSNFADTASALGGSSDLNGQQSSKEPNKTFSEHLADALSMVFAGKQIGEAMSTAQAASLARSGNLGVDYPDYSRLSPAAVAKLKSEGQPTTLEEKKAYDANNASASGPTGAQVLGDVGLGALQVLAPGIGGEGSLATKLATNAAVGAGMGATSAVSNGSTDLGDIASQAGGGALGGSAGTLAGEALVKLTSALPSRLIKQVLPQLKNPETVDYALNNLKLGTVDSMVESSKKALNSYDSQINAILQHPDYANLPVQGEHIIGMTLNQFPNSEYTAESIIAKLKTQLPSEAKIFTTLENGGTLPLDEANRLRQQIDRITYKTAIDSPEVKAGKDLAAAFGNSLRATVQTTAPETQPIFANYSKEINVQKALQKLLAKGDKAAFVNMSDLMTAGVGGVIGGAPGAVASAVGEKITSNPVVKIGAAKVINALRPATKGLATVTKVAGAMAGKKN